MASIIAAGTTSGTAISVSGDTSGQLVLQTNGTTTAVTIDTGQVVTLAQPLPVASGGSGVTTSTGTGANVLSISPSLTTPALGTPASADFTTIAATQVQQEAGTALTAPVTPGRQQYHPSAAKAWIRLNGVGTIAITASFNVASITDNGVGLYTVTLTTAFSSSSAYGVVGSCKLTDNQLNEANFPSFGALVAGSFKMETVNANGTQVDCAVITCATFGDQ